jgi:hypothetical protein
MTVMLTTTPSLCRICFWRRNDIALRIASSISTSNCDPTAMAAVRTFAAAAATPAPWHDVVARFGPEWNSLGMNKTRFFNILEGVHDTGCTVLLHSFRRRKSPGGDPACEAVKFS